MSRFSDPAVQREWRKLRKAVWARDKGVCGVCGGMCYSDAWHLGHIVDHMVGGADSLENLLVMHDMCNQFKPVHESRAEFDAWVKAGHWHNRAHNYLKLHSLDYSEEIVTALLKHLCNIE